MDGNETILVLDTRRETIAIFYPRNIKIIREERLILSQVVRIRGSHGALANFN